MFFKKNKNSGVTSSNIKSFTGYDFDEYFRSKEGTRPDNLQTGYMTNVIAHRCIKLIAKSVASVKFDCFENGEEVKNSAELRLLRKPNPFMSSFEFIESIFSSLLIWGNAYIMCVKGENGILEMYSLKPDSVIVKADHTGFPMQYIYTSGSSANVFDIDNITGMSEILHIKNFNPMGGTDGLSPMDVAMPSIEQHNEAIKWNKSLLQNGARPSGALVVDGNSDGLTDEQFDRLKVQIKKDFSGSSGAGKVMVLEGGLKWQEMSMNPKDMDFIEVKNSAAKDIALAFSVPSNLLGIKGDNTYSNFSESRIAFWEETIIPHVLQLAASFSEWFSFHKGKEIEIVPDMDSITVLTDKRYSLWNYINASSFLSDEEKRKMLGF